MTTDFFNRALADAEYSYEWLRTIQQVSGGPETNFFELTGGRIRDVIQPCDGDVVVSSRRRLITVFQCTRIRSGYLAVGNETSSQQVFHVSSFLFQYAIDNSPIAMPGMSSQL